MEKVKCKIKRDLNSAKNRLRKTEEEKNKLLGEIKGYENCLLILESYGKEKNVEMIERKKD